jgi:RNA polymerase sigma-70 factor (ECF subfamily)
VGFTLEPALVLDARHSDAALDALLVEIWPEAYRVAFGVLHDRGLAEDAAQEACASIARGLPSLRSCAAFYGWMYRIVARHATVVAKRRKRTAELDYPIEPRVVTSEDDRLDILDAIARLPLSQRCCVVLRYYAGLNSSEIAAALGAPAPTIRFQLMLARRALRSTLASIDSQSPEMEAYQNAR